jgi:hypothetical protein
MLPITRYRIYMRISYLFIFTSTELEFLKIITLPAPTKFSVPAKFSIP